MGSGDWLKNIIISNKERKQKSSKTKGLSQPETNGCILKSCVTDEPTYIISNKGNVALIAEDIAAIRIQTAFRGFKARKFYCNSKRLVRLQMLMGGDFGKKQTWTTLRNLQSWSKIQSQIRSSRLAMVEENGIKQKKLENKLKLDAKVRDHEVEWSGSSYTMVEALARIKQKEEATLKRERAMAYAFSHQWRPHSNSKITSNDSDVATSNWGWSWMDRWIADRPWESQAVVVLTPNKLNTPPNKKSTSNKNSNSMKTSPNSKKTLINRRLSYESSIKREDVKTKHTTIPLNYGGKNC